MGLIGCPETSGIIYHYTLRNNPEEWKSRDVRMFPYFILWNVFEDFCKLKLEVQAE
jgi:hypothetical protein